MKRNFLGFRHESHYIGFKGRHQSGALAIRSLIEKAVFLAPAKSVGVCAQAPLEYRGHGSVWPVPLAEHHPALGKRGRWGNGTGNWVFSQGYDSERKDHILINNRQAGRRNRGRNNNNGRPNGNNRGGGDNGNRIDNRARGNAAQLLEKYKNMARDAQMMGDRVNAEYYLQFADHYFRVLADNRARQEEQQQRFRPRDDSFEDDADDFDGADDNGEDFRNEAPADRAPREQDYRQDRQEGRNRDRDDRGNRDDRNNNNNRRDRNRRDRFQGGEFAAEGETGSPAAPAAAPVTPVAEPAAQAAAASQPEAEAPAKPRRGRPRKVDVAAAAQAEGFDATLLPPSIPRSEETVDQAEEAPKKRTRRPRAAAAEAAE